MNPFIQSALRRILPLLLAALVPVLTRWLDADTAARLVADLGSLLTAIIWSALQTRTSRQEKLTGLALPKGSTEADATAAVKLGKAPSISTGVHEIPVLSIGKK